MDAQTGPIVSGSGAAVVGEVTQDMFIGIGPKERKRQGMAEESTTSPACPFCLEDFEFGNMLSVMPCSHRFHVGCLAKWLALSHRCPCCRRALPVISRDTRPFRRRSSRNRQANVRLFGPEWYRA